MSRAAWRARIAELLLQIKKLRQRDIDNATSPPHPSLLGIPRELRDRILDMAVFHELSNGVISPLPDVRSEPCMALLRIAQDPSDSRRLPVSEHWSAESLPDMPCDRFRIDCKNQPIVSQDPPLRDPNGMSHSTMMKEHARRYLAEDKMRYLFSGTENATSGHFCTLDCFLQPPITMVCFTLHDVYSLRRPQNIRLRRIPDL